MSNNVNKILEKINNLTDDEDLRQELWVLYLEEGESVLTEEGLERIKREKNVT